MNNSQMECRDIGIAASHLEYRAQGRKMGGYAATYGTESGDLGGFTETIAPGAFRSILMLNPDVILNLNHDNNFILGRTGAGTLQLQEDDKGLRFEADLADTATIRDMILSPMQRGELKGMSFAFVVDKDGQSWSASPNGMRKRTINQFRGLHDVSLVAKPAYDGTSVAFRSPQDVLREFANGKRDIGTGPTVDPRIDLYRRKLALLSL